MGKVRCLLMTAFLAAVIFSCCAVFAGAVPDTSDTAAAAALTNTGALETAETAGEETGESGVLNRKDYLIRGGVVLGAGIVLYAVVSVRSRRR